MARFDSGAHFDSGVRFDEEDPPPNPKPRKRTMTLRQDYFPNRIGDQLVWLRNFKNKLPGHAPTLGLDSGDVTAVLLDADNAVYALDGYRSAVTTFSEAAFRRIDDALADLSVPGTIEWLPFAAPAGAPTAVSYGCLRRVFDYINRTIKKAAAYDGAIGNDLGTEKPAAAAPSPTVSPEFDLRETSDDKVEIVWTKGVYDGVKIEVDRGAAGGFTDTDLRPNYTLNWLPTAGTATVIKVRLKYIYKGEEFGNWSEWKTWTLAGA